MDDYLTKPVTLKSLRGLSIIGPGAIMVHDPAATFRLRVPSDDVGRRWLP